MSKVAMRQHRSVNIRGKSRVVFFPDDLPSMADGFILYRGIVVCWDKSRSPLVLNWIDKLEPNVREQLVAVRESRGVLELTLTANKIPTGYEPETLVEAPNGRQWKIAAMKLLG